VGCLLTHRFWRFPKPMLPISLQEKMHCTIMQILLKSFETYMMGIEVMCIF
jgi:hypothetical protein